MIKSLAITTFILEKVYLLKVLITTYVIFLLTDNAVFEGKVHGVVVHARKNKSENFFNLGGNVELSTSN